MAFNYDGNGNISITYSTTKAKADAVLEAAAHALYDEGYGDHGTDGTRPYSAVTFNEKRGLLDQFVRRSMVEKAKGYHLRSATDTAYAQASTELPGYDI